MNENGNTVNKKNSQNYVGRQNIQVSRTSQSDSNSRLCLQIRCDCEHTATSQCSTLLCAMPMATYSRKRMSWRICTLCVTGFPCAPPSRLAPPRGLPPPRAQHPSDGKLHNLNSTILTPRMFAQQTQPGTRARALRSGSPCKHLPYRKPVPL